MQLQPTAVPSPHALFPRGLAALCGAIALCNNVLAQDLPPRDPADSRAGVPPVIHRSTLSASPGAAPVAADTWREANDTAARIGGWRAYLREAQTPAQLQPTAPQPATAPAPPAPGAQPDVRSGPSPSPASSMPAAAPAPPAASVPPSAATPTARHPHQ